MLSGAVVAVTAMPVGAPVVAPVMSEEASGAKGGSGSAFPDVGGLGIIRSKK